MAHIEHLGTQALHLVIDPAKLRRKQNGHALLATMNGSTTTLLRFSPELAEQLPKHRSYMTLKGPSDLHISVGDDCSLTGVQTLDVADILVIGTAVSAPVEELEPMAIPF